MIKLTKFNQAYEKIIQQSILKSTLRGLGKTFAKKLMPTNNKEIQKTLEKALVNYNFDFGEESENGQDFLTASKVISRGNNYYKIIITHDYDVSSDKLDYSIQCVNIKSGKKVKIKSNNFILKDTLTADEIINKVVNNCIFPLKITKQANKANQVEKTITSHPEAQNKQQNKQQTKSKPQQQKQLQQPKIEDKPQQQTKKTGSTSAEKQQKAKSIKPEKKDAKTPSKSETNSEKKPASKKAPVKKKTDKNKQQV